MAPPSPHVPPHGAPATATAGRRGTAVAQSDSGAGAAATAGMGGTAVAQSGDSRATVHIHVHAPAPAPAAPAPQGIQFSEGRIVHVHRERQRSPLPAALLAARARQPVAPDLLDALAHARSVGCISCILLLYPAT
eukprot:1474032-Rhodomonas_salina.1